MTDKTSTAPVMSLSELIDAYWDCAYKEGQEGRDHDTARGDAQRIRSAINAFITSPTPDVVGGDVVLPEPIGLSPCAPISLEWMAERRGRREGWNDCLKKVKELNSAPRVQGDSWQTIDSVVAELSSDEAGKEALRLAREELHADLASHPVEQTRGNGCPCEPSGSDGLSCPGADGRLLCDPAKDEQTRGDGVVVYTYHFDHETQSRYLLDGPVADGDKFVTLAAYEALASAAPRQAVPDELIADLRKFHEETEACDEFDLSNEATAALLAANLIEGTHFVLTAKGEAMLAAAPSAGRMGVDRG